MSGESCRKEMRHREQARRLSSAVTLSEGWTCQVDRRNQPTQGKLEQERPHLQLLPTASVPEYVTHQADVRK